MSLLNRFFPNKTRGELVSEKVEKVFTCLTNDIEIEFTEMEIVQVLNSVRRMLSVRIKEKKSEAMEQSLNYSIKSKSIEDALKYLE